jgi:hypothetical protein
MFHIVFMSFFWFAPCDTLRVSRGKKGKNVDFGRDDDDGVILEAMTMV